MSQRLLINMDQLDIARNISLFSDLTENEKDSLLKEGGIYSYRSKECLFMEGDPIKFLYIVCDGLVQEFRQTADGRELTVNIHKKGDVFCKTEIFLNEGLHNTNAMAIDSAYVMELPIDKFKESLQKHKSVAQRLASSLARFAAMKQIEVEQQATMTSAQILALFLRQTCASHGLDPRGFSLPYKKSLIASRLGMKLETLSRALPKLKEQGITVKGSHVSFTDLKASGLAGLQAAARGNAVKFFPPSRKIREMAHAS